ncbi:MAG: hypothetical protein V3T05_12455 [Myxococcota bacterium]
MKAAFGPAILFALMASIIVACGSGSRPRKDDNGGTSCGNGTIDSGEMCDGTNLGSSTCASRGFAGGTLVCLSTCDGFDESACQADPDCGNGRIDSGEECDPTGPNLDSETCETRGYAGGTLGCAASCTFDISGCSSQQAQCGNDRREGTEECDGVDLDGKTCVQLTGNTGTLACASGCTFDTTDCTGTTVVECGNDQIDGTDVCDGSDLAGLGCTDLGYTGGPLTCLADCSGYETGACTGIPPSCTGPDGYRDGGLNTGLVDGEPCNFDSDCAAQNCTTSYYCGPPGTPPTMHAGDLQMGAACDTNASCASGHCWQGGDTWICAETCATPIVATAPGLACQTDDGSPTGASCHPGPGAGAVGDACISGSFDCADPFCIGEDFCSRFCDPTAPAGGEPGCPSASTCTEVAAGTGFYLCVPDSRIGTVPVDGECDAAWDCVAGTECIGGNCRTPCPNGDECNASTHYCATDHPSGPTCMPSADRVDVGDPCQLNSECNPGLVCFDEGAGSTCHDVCPNGDSDCTGGTSCVPAPTGSSLDTVIDVFDDETATLALASDDDGGPGLFSLVALPVTAGPHTYWIEARGYSASTIGTYSLTVSLSAGPGSVITSESEPNNTRAAPQTIFAGDIINAEFVAGASADLDIFRIDVNPTADDTLTIATESEMSGVCISGPALADDGEPCSSAQACQNDCFPFMRVGVSFCATPCVDATGCGGGTCESFADANPAQGYCFPAGAVTPGTGAFGDPCNGPHECASRTCVQHKYDTAWRCGGECSVADTACSGTGMCNGADPIYIKICTPTLGGTVPPGGNCLWDADCQTDNVCLGEVCQPQAAVSRYDVDPDVALGLPCNLDDDCTSGTCAAFADGLFCTDDTITGCDPNGVTDVLDTGELCDGADVDSITCDALVPGTTGTPSCTDDCSAWDVSACSDGLAPGQPCNAGIDCATGDICFHGGNTWFCAGICTDANDMSCTGTMFAGALAVGCEQQPDGSYACVPTPGTAAPNDPCRSSYLDCDSGLCWAGSVCRDRCDLENPTCIRDESCVSFEITVGFGGQTDTQISVVDVSDTALAGPVDDAMDPDQTWRVSFYSPVPYTKTGGAGSVFIKVEGFSSSVSGDYQLQAFTDLFPPPFGAAILESELRSTNPIPNGNLAAAEFQDLDFAGLPQRVDANLATGTTGDVDYYRVYLQDGEALSAQTTYSLAHVCWPDAELLVDTLEPCDYDFECVTGKCIGYCALECTDGSTCEAGTTCNSYFGDLRSYCFEALKFGDDCESLVPGPGGDMPSCPNNYCLRHPFDPSEAFWCSDACLTDQLGTGCGELDAVAGNFNGECTTLSTGQFVCVKHNGRSVAAGGDCLLNGDCISNCCNPASNLCNAITTGCIQ